MNKEELFLQTANDQANELEDSRKHVDTRATGILGLGGALIGSISLVQNDWADWSFIPVIFVIVGFVGVSFTSLASIWLRKWEFQPPLQDLYKHIESEEYEDEILVLWTGKQIMSATANNRKALNSKSLCLSWAYISLLIEIVALGTFITSVFI